MMKRFRIAVTCTSLVVLLCGSISYGMDANVAALKSDLNAEFGRQAGDDMFVISVTRSPILSGSAPLISHNEFEQVLKLLYASCVNPGCWLTRWWRRSEAAPAPVYSRDNVTLNSAVDQSIGGSLPPKTIEAINAISQSIGRYFIRNNMQDACKLVVFNEMFFSQLAPLTADQKNFIENKLLNLSKDSLNTVFYPNFLYTENRRVPGRTVYDSLVRMRVEAGVPNTGSSGTGANSSGIPATPISGLNPTMIFNQAARSLNGCAREIRRNNVPNDGNLVDWEYLVNETYAINNGSVLTKYKKVGYFKESDIAIERGALYDSGPGYDEAVLVGPSTLRDRLLRNISIDVCLDLNLGIRTNRIHHWSNPGGVPLGDSRLHLVQSNSIDPFCNPTNMRNLPLDRGILHVDAYPYPSWDMPAISRPQDIYLPYVTLSGSITGSGSSTGRRIIQDDFLNYKEEFHLRIVASDYRFSFLRM